MRKLFVLVIGMTIYGSLFPFAFSALDSGARWDMLFHSFSPFTSIGDILGNIALFVPFGLLGPDSLAGSRKGRPPYAKILLSGLLLALVIQVIQVYVPGRDPSFADVYWNMAGITAGMGVSRVIRTYFPGLSLANVGNAPAILALIWLLYVFFPFVPTLDFQEIKNGLKPLLLTPAFAWDHYLIGVSGWLTFAYLSRTHFSRLSLARTGLPLVALLSLPLRLLILENQIDVSDVAAILSALAIWYFLAMKNAFNLDRPMAFLLVVTLVVYGVGSLDFGTADPAFAWVPFSGFLEGSLFHNTRSLFFKIFLFGSLILLVRRGWPDYRLRALWVFTVVLTIELLQIFMASHTAEITDPLLVLLLAAILHPGARLDPAPAVTASATTATDAGPEKKPEITGPRTQLAWLTGSITLLTLLMTIVIRLPGVPYNVRELFRLDGHFIAIIPFAAFILWVGMGAPFISGRLLKRPARHFIRFPLWVIVAGLIGYGLLALGVTSEAMDDITGSSHIYWFVQNKNIWGDFGLTLARLLPFPGLWNQIEEIVRFLALWSPVTFMLCLFYHPIMVVRKYEIEGLYNQSRLFALCLFLYGLYALPWFYLCKLVAFDHTSTDNLNELIAGSGFFGLGGGGYLYLLFLLLALNGVWIRQGATSGMIKLLLTLVAGGVGWSLLNLGLASEIHKYGQTFSGVDFLLGPDRRVKLPETMLFFRWIILYTGSVTVLAFAMRFDISTIVSLASRQTNNGADFKNAG